MYRGLTNNKKYHVKSFNNKNELHSFKYNELIDPNHNCVKIEYAGKTLDFNEKDIVEEFKKYKYCVFYNLVKINKELNLDE
jgi:hypothetical protein